MRERGTYQKVSGRRVKKAQPFHNSNESGLDKKCQDILLAAWFLFMCCLSVQNPIGPQFHCTCTVVQKFGVSLSKKLKFLFSIYTLHVLKVKVKTCTLLQKIYISNKCCFLGFLLIKESWKVYHVSTKISSSTTVFEIDNEKYFLSRKSA